MQPHFYALLFGLCSEVGHLFEYHLVVQRALQSLGWKYVALVPQKAKSLPLPENWSPCLANDCWGERKSLFFRFKMFLSNSIKIRRFFQSIKSEKNVVVFLESFELQQLASLFVALLCTFRPAFKFWILHRYVYDSRHLKTRVFRIFHWLLERKLGRESVVYLTDSELLAKEQGKVLNKKISVVPIPHTETQAQRRSFSTDQIMVWWPGGSIREDKGLSRMVKIVQAVQANERIEIVVAEKAKQFVPLSPQVKFIPTVLSRAEYMHWMHQADFIVLPYSAKEYAHRTSGIFVEAVCSGKIPLVTEGTWMAYELKRFGLQQLVVDWETVDIVKALTSFQSDPNVSQALKQMTTEYQRYHSAKNFAHAISLIHS